MSRSHRRLLRNVNKWRGQCVITGHDGMPICYTSSRRQMALIKKAILHSVDSVPVIDTGMTYRGIPIKIANDSQALLSV
jgi:hypothetical protein